MHRMHKGCICEMHKGCMKGLTGLLSVIFTGRSGPAQEGGSAGCSGGASRRRDCHSAAILYL